MRQSRQSAKQHFCFAPICFTANEVIPGSLCNTNVHCSELTAVLRVLFNIKCYFLSFCKGFEAI